MYTQNKNLNTFDNKIRCVSILNRKKLINLYSISLLVPNAYRSNSRI